MVIALKASQQATIADSTGICVADQPVGVAAAVPLLVRRAHDPADLAEEAAHAVEHPLALDRVRLDDEPLVVGQRARLVDDLLRHGDLAHVVEQRAELDVAALPRAQPHGVGHRHRQRDDAAAVEAGVLVVDLEHVAQQQRRAAVGAAQLDRLAHARAALEGEDEQQAGEREHEQHGVRARCTAAIATSRPTGESSTSTSVTQPNSEGWSFSGDAEARPVAQRRDAVVDATCAASAASRTGQSPRSRRGRPRRRRARPPGRSRARRRRRRRGRGSDGGLRAGTPAGRRAPSRPPRAAAPRRAARGRASARARAGSGS